MAFSKDSQGMRRPGQRPPEAWSFLPPYQEKPIPEKFRVPAPPLVASMRSYASAAHPAPAAPERPGHTVLGKGPYKTLRDWSLVLASQDIPHRFEQSPEGPWFIEVLDSRVENAAHQIRLYREENPDRQALAPLPALHWSPQPLWVLLIPAIGTFWQANHVPTFERAGIADAERILHGEWWRVFTALTLHGDSAHLASNLVSGFFVLALLAARLPLSRLVPQLVLASGLANLAVATLIRDDFRSLGFSTFVFAALGALGTMELRLKPADDPGILRRFAPWFGVFALAMLMGLGENSDIFAHFIGLAFGAVAGFVPRKRELQWGRPTGLVDVLIAGGVYAFFVLVWMRALGQLPLF